MMFGPFEIFLFGVFFGLFIAWFVGKFRRKSIRR